MATSKATAPARTVSRRHFVAGGAAVGALAGLALDDAGDVQAAGQATPSTGQPDDPAQVHSPNDCGLPADPARISGGDMLARTGGKNRTREEYGALLEPSRFAVTRMLPASGDLAIIEAVAR